MAKIHSLIHQFSGRCNYCGASVCVTTLSEPFHATVDHDIPKARGGDNSPANLLLCCLRCNQAKGDMTGDEFRSFMETGKLPEPYAVYLAQRIQKLLAGRAPIVVHPDMRIAAGKPRMIRT